MANLLKTSAFLGALNEFEEKHAPKELYYEGNKNLLHEGIRVSIVGSRQASKTGIRRVRSFATACVKHNITTVSGLAEGIDSIAHETAIAKGGKTIAVLGTLLDKAYPSKNKHLLERIKKAHLAISQFPVGYPFKKENFPRRNRTMALISDATVIIEAGEKSGARHQGREALRLGRLVFVMKNIVDDEKLTWPREMIEYGAQVLSRDDMPEILYDIPSFTSGASVAL